MHKIYSNLKRCKIFYFNVCGNAFYFGDGFGNGIGASHCGDGCGCGFYNAVFSGKGNGDGDGLEEWEYLPIPKEHFYFEE